LNIGNISTTLPTGNPSDMVFVSSVTLANVPDYGVKAVSFLPVNLGVPFGQRMAFHLCAPLGVGVQFIQILNELRPPVFIFYFFDGDEDGMRYFPWCRHWLFTWGFALFIKKGVRFIR